MQKSKVVQFDVFYERLVDKPKLSIFTKFANGTITEYTTRTKVGILYAIVRFANEQGWKQIIDVAAVNVFNGNVSLKITIVRPEPRTSFPLLTVGREDFETKGYDVSGVSDETLERWVWKAGEGDGIMEDFWLTIDQIAEDHDLPRLEVEDEDEDRPCSKCGSYWIIGGICDKCGKLQD